jgi:hypothetical protein
VDLDTPLNGVLHAEVGVDFPHRYWQIDAQTRAGDALNREINQAD